METFNRVQLEQKMENVLSRVNRDSMLSPDIAQAGTAAKEIVQSALDRIKGSVMPPVDGAAQGEAQAVLDEIGSIERELNA